MRDPLFLWRIDDLDRRLHDRQARRRKEEDHLRLVSVALCMRAEGQGGLYRVATKPALGVCEVLPCEAGEKVIRDAVREAVFSGRPIPKEIADAEDEGQRIVRRFEHYTGRGSRMLRIGVDGERRFEAARSSLLEPSDESRTFSAVSCVNHDGRSAALRLISRAIARPVIDDDELVGRELRELIVELLQHWANLRSRLVSRHNHAKIQRLHRKRRLHR